MINPASPSGKADAAQLAPEVRRGLDQLARALDYAQDLDSSFWDFAVEIDRLLALGMTTSDLRWLVKRGYVSHAREITASQDADRRFEPPEPNLGFARNTCFVLTEAGFAILGREYPAAKHVIRVGHVYSGSTGPNSGASGPNSGPSGQARTADDCQVNVPSQALSSGQPHENSAANWDSVLPSWDSLLPKWDKDSRTFLVGEYLVKRFRVPSPNQESVLDAFQEEGWPASIDDPLAPVAEVPPKRRLRDTIKCLNLNQAAQLIRFHGDGTGQRIRWELLPDSAALGNSSDVGFTNDRPLRRAA